MLNKEKKQTNVIQHFKDKKYRRQTHLPNSASARLVSCLAKLIVSWSECHKQFFTRVQLVTRPSPDTE